jgi:iron complex transport system ATP-binding protein
LSADAPPVLELDGVAVAGNGGPPRLQDVTWRVREGEHWAVLGANGAGKSTLLDVVAGKVPVAQGSVAVLGSELGAPGVRDPRRHLGVIDATPQPFARSMRPIDVVLNGVAGSVAEQGRRASADERDRALELLGTLGCAAFLDRRFEDCSRGERQRVLVARALIRRPRILTFDEPTTALDLPGRETFLEALAAVARDQPGLATVTVTHHVEELPASTTHALLLRGGRVTGQGDAMRTLSGPRLSACFDLPLTVRRSGGRWFASTR